MDPMRPSPLAICIAAILSALLGPVSATAQTGGDLQIVWEVKSRFRLFRAESDFLRHVASAGHGVLAAEQRLANETGGRGWARLTVNALCVDAAGRLAEPCERDGVKESYLAPADHPIGIRIAGTLPPAAVCTLNLDNGDGAPHRVQNACAQEVEARVPYGRPTIASVEVATPDGEVRTATTEILVRDLLIAGIGDSIAAGEGNPDRPITLSDEGFCFRQFVSGSGSDYFRPSRAGFKGERACDAGRSSMPGSAEWTRLGAHWMNQACHRSLYSYQVRAALALAVEHRHVAVTFVPLACTGATIESGLLGGQRARELRCGTTACPGTMPAQIAQLREVIAAAKRRDPTRGLDLVLLTVGANDIYFSGLVADVILESTAERVLFGRSGVIASVADADAVLERKLPRDFAKLRASLKPLVGNLSRVVYVSYGHPALAADGSPCNTGRDGFDIHPGFGIDAARLQRVANFVRERFLPRLKALATCSGGALCNDSTETMTFVDSHQPAFAGRGLCARASTDPEFDRECFKPDGTSFTEDLARSATEPLACGRSVKEFRPYATRARWIRTANDSYFAAMTYPEGISSALQPSDIHDATWGVLSAVYGGAVHPTAEGHAVMAEAALADMRRVLKLVRRGEPIFATPLPALDLGKPSTMIRSD